MLKSILITTGIFPPDSGGPATYVPRIAEFFDADGVMVQVVCLSDNCPDRFDTKFRFKIRRVSRSLQKLVRRVVTVREIYKASEKADVVFINGLLFESIIAARILRRKPCVVKFVGDFVWEAMQNRGAINYSLEEYLDRRLPFGWGFIRRLQVLALLSCEAVITPSEYLKTYVKKLTQHNRLTVIRNSVHPASVIPSNDDRAFDIVTVCRLVPWKGVDEIIDYSKRKGLRLLVVGDGPLRCELEARAGDSLGRNIIFAGNVEQSDVRTHLRSAKLFVLNSRYEGLPHIVIEAWRAGVPVVASNAGGTTELVENGVTGFVYQNCLSTEFDDSIQRLLGSARLRTEFVNNANKLLDSQFRFDQMALETKQLLLDASVA